MKKIHIAALVVLTCFYAVLGYLSLNPNVSAEYRDYYINKTTSISPTQLKRLQPVEIGIPYAHTDEIHLGFKSGWSNAEKDFRWNSGHAASIVFIATARQQSEAKTLHLKFHMQSSQIVEISLNGVPVFDKHLQDATEAIEIKIAPNCLKTGLNSIEFRFPNAKKPGTSDSRLLALALREIRFD